MENSKIPAFKIVIVGDKSVGKTSIVKRFASNFFTTMTESTIGSSFMSKVMEVKA